MARKKKKQEEVKHEKKFYEKNYKLFLIFPLILLIISAFFIYGTIQQEGTPIYRDISLKGGLSAIIDVDTDILVSELENKFDEDYPRMSFSVSELYEEGERVGFIIDTTMDEEEFIDYASGVFGVSLEYGDNYSSNFISPTLSQAFFKQAIIILVISFVLMSIVIFWYFREIVPSAAVVISAIFDVVVTIGFLNAFGFEISIAGVGALLMIIGYSIDTDVLLTNRLIREDGKNYFNKALGAFKTGILMSGTTLLGGVAAVTISISQVIDEIAMILIVGLLVDFVSTWLQNTAILLWWLEKRDSKENNVKN